MQTEYLTRNFTQFAECSELILAFYFPTCCWDVKQATNNKYFHTSVFRTDVRISDNRYCTSHFLQLCSRMSNTSRVHLPSGTTSLLNTSVLSQMEAAIVGKCYCPSTLHKSTENNNLQDIQNPWMSIQKQMLWHYICCAYKTPMHLSPLHNYHKRLCHVTVALNKGQWWLCPSVKDNVTQNGTKLMSLVITILANQDKKKLFIGTEAKANTSGRFYVQITEVMLSPLNSHVKLNSYKSLRKLNVSTAFWTTSE